MACNQDSDGYSTAEENFDVEDETDSRKILERVLQSGADINTKMRGGCTRLHNAVRDSDLEGLCMLIERGANVNIADDAGQLPLHRAAITGEVHMLKKLAEFRGTINVKDKHGFTALNFVVLLQNLDGVEALLNAGADVEINDIIGHFHWLTIDKSEELDRDAGGIVDDCIRSPTFAHRHRGVWKKLLNRCPEVLADGFAMFPLLPQLFCSDSLDYFGDILEAGADLNMLLHISAKSFEENVLATLLNFDVDVNVQNIEGSTALHVACKHLNLKAALLLLDAGARWDIRDRDGKTMMWHLLYSTYRYRNVEVPLLAMILQRTNDGTVIDSATQKTAAHLVTKYCIIKQNFEIAMLVLSLEKDLNARDSRGLTVLNCITSHLLVNGRENCEELIRNCIAHGAYLTALDFKFIRAADAILQANLLKDVQLCAMSVANKFNYDTLPRLYRHLDNNRPLRLPSINNFRIIYGGSVWRTIEGDVTSEIETNGYCSVSRVVTTSLSMRCVEVYCSAMADNLTDSTGALLDMSKEGLNRTFNCFDDSHMMLLPLEDGLGYFDDSFEAEVDFFRDFIREVICFLCGQLLSSYLLTFFKDFFHL